MQATKLVFVPSSARNKHMQIEAKCNVAPVNRVAGKSGGRDRNRGNKEGETRTLSLWLKGGFPRERGKWLANSNLFRNCLGRCVINLCVRFTFPGLLISAWPSVVSFTRALSLLFWYEIGSGLCSYFMI